MKSRGGQRPVTLPIRKLIPIAARKLNRLLVHPSELRLLSMAALRRTPRKTPYIFSRHGTMNTLRPMNLICEIKFGSHLYGTSTPSSDLDYKGIFLPTIEEVLLGRIPKTASSSPSDDTRKNEAGELDCEYYSLHHFLRLATQGQTVAVDMLFAPENCVYKDPKNGWVWDRIIADRDRLLSKQMNAFIGYARGQAAKYSMKGDRLNQLQNAVAILHAYSDDEPLEQALRLEALNPYLQNAIQDCRTNPQKVLEVQIGGKWFGDTTRIELVRESIQKAIDRYGKRAHAAADSEGVDWKALSHAVRVSKELIELLSFGRVNFPLADAPLLLDIKQGRVPLETVQGILDTDLAFVELQAQQSTLPDRVDAKWWDQFLVDIMCEHISNELVKALND